MADPAVLVMIYVVLSQQNESRELLAGRSDARCCGAHLRKQVQGSVAHGTGGVGPFVTAVSTPSHETCVTCG